MDRPETFARSLVIGLLLAVLLGVSISEWTRRSQGIEIHARLPENGGWIPGDFTARAGEPVRVRLTSDDVVHGFAIGQSQQPPVDVQPGQFTELSLLFDRPGRYTYYCTRWCGVNHWRMRGTIEVTGGTPQQEEPAPPLYVQLGLDIDAEHHAENQPARRPSARRGARLEQEIPDSYLTPDFYRSHTPEEAWKEVRQLLNLRDADAWDLVAYIWQMNAPARILQEGQQLYSADCAACHGETGRGDGVYAAELAVGISTNHSDMPSGEMTQAPADFSQAEHMLAASPAHLQGKILRGGMGTGMPSWGPVLTDEQTWALVAYLWTFQFDMNMEVKP